MFVEIEYREEEERGGRGPGTLSIELWQQINTFPIGAKLSRIYSRKYFASDQTLYFPCVIEKVRSVDTRWSSDSWPTLYDARCTHWAIVPKHYNSIQSDTWDRVLSKNLNVTFYIYNLQCFSRACKKIWTQGLVSKQHSFMITVDLCQTCAIRRVQVLGVAITITIRKPDLGWVRSCEVTGERFGRLDIV